MSDILRRFWAKVDKTGGPDACWLWTGGKLPLGYGMFHFSMPQIHIYAHRFAYITEVGAIPPGLVIDHLCRNPSCVNPKHLEPVTQRVNSLRGIGFAAVNAAKTHCKRGHEFTPENTRPLKNGRACRTCEAIKYRERHPLMEKPTYRGTKLKPIIHAQGLRQNWLASKLGISEAMLSRMITGSRNVPEPIANQLVTILRVPFDMAFDLPIGSKYERIDSKEDIAA